MKYVFDSNSLITLFDNFYESRFPSLWEKFDRLVVGGKIVSVREVQNELNNYHGKVRLTDWTQTNSTVFEQPTTEEMEFLKVIFQNSHFIQIIEQKKIYEGKPVADPLIIAKGKITAGIVVTEEIYKENGAKIPNICQYFDVQCINLEGFMEWEKWVF